MCRLGCTARRQPIRCQLDFDLRNNDGAEFVVFINVACLVKKNQAASAEECRHRHQETLRGLRARSVMGNANNQSRAQHPTLLSDELQYQHFRLQKKVVYIAGDRFDLLKDYFGTECSVRGWGDGRLRTASAKYCMTSSVETTSLRGEKRCAACQTAVLSIARAQAVEIS